MKKNQRLSFRILLIALLLLAHLDEYAQIGGPARIRPDGTASEYSVDVNCAGCFTSNWTISSPNTTLSPFNGGECHVTPNFQEQSCSLVLSADLHSYDGNGHPVVTTLTKNIIILPYIVPSDVYVGQTTTFHIENACGFSCSNYNWNIGQDPVTSTNLCALPCDPHSSTFLVTCPLTGFPTDWTLNCTDNCIQAQNYAGGALNTVSGFVKLGPIPSITGYPDIGCSYAPAISYPLTYSVPSVPGATTYNWTLPNFMTITQGLGTNIITVDATGTGTGTISIQAVMAGAGNPVSDVVKKQVNVCCIPSVTLNSGTNDVASPSTDSREAAILINASNTINSGATAFYHAAAEVQLNPGFSAVPGSNLHAYTAGCGAGYSRLMNPNETQSPGDASTTVPDVTTQDIKNTNGSNSNLQAFNMQIIPNPSTGVFKVELKNTSEYPASVSIIDSFGKTVFENNTPRSTSLDFNIASQPEGLYIIKVVYKGDTYSQKIIKN